jgi:hypothetical protein
LWIYSFVLANWRMRIMRRGCLVKSHIWKRWYRLTLWRWTTCWENAIKDGLPVSTTAYMSCGKGPRTPLRFSKSGDPNIEEAYLTHYRKPE